MTTDNNNPPAEREAFEEWFEADRLPLEHSNWFRRDDDGDYEISSVNISWRAWQARAALASHSASPPAGTRPLADLIAKYEADPAKAEKLAAARSALRGDAAAAREPLTEEQIDALWAKAHRVTTPMGWVVEDAMAHALARAVESAHGAFDVVRASALAAAEARADAAHEEWQGSQLMLELANTRAEAAEAERDALRADAAPFLHSVSVLEAEMERAGIELEVLRAERDALRRALLLAKEIVDDECESLSLHRHPEGMSTAGWQPIETAPKDGTRIILFYRQHERIVCGAWDADRYAKRPRPYWRSDVEWIFGTRDAREFPPTHWLPLPAVPSSTAQT